MDVWIWGSEETFVPEVVAVRHGGDGVVGESRSPLRGRWGGGSSVGPWAASPFPAARGHGKAPTGRKHRRLSPWPGEGSGGRGVPDGEHDGRKQEPGTPGCVDSFLESTPVSRRDRLPRVGPGAACGAEAARVSAPGAS